jgi:periplasmic protein TonB
MTLSADLIESPGARTARWIGAALLVLVVHAGCAALALLHRQQEELADAAAGVTIVEMLPAPAVPLDSPDVAPGPQVEEATLAPAPSLESKPEVVPEQLPNLEPAPLAPEPEVVLPRPVPVEEAKPKEDKEREVEVRDKVETPESAAPLTMAPPRVEPTEEAIRTAPSAGMASERVKRAQVSWQKALVSHLNRFKRYPDGARARGSQGSVLVEFTVDRSGKVVTSRVLQHSGSTVLDEEAIAVLQRASPLPSPPAEMAGELFPLTLPIQFRIK